MRTKGKPCALVSGELTVRVERNVDVLRNTMIRSYAEGMNCRRERRDPTEPED